MEGGGGWDPKGSKHTYHFAGGETRSPPGRGVGRAAVVAFSADAVGELRRRVVGVDDVVGLSGVWLGGDHGGPDLARAGMGREAGLGLVGVAGHRAGRLVRVWRSLAHGRTLGWVLVVGCRRLRDL